MKSARILCIDDDPRINELNRIALTRQGYEVEICSSPTDALEHFAAGTFDLVISDMFRPASVDSAFLAKLKSEAPSLPIILVSGDHEPPAEVLKYVDVFIEKAYSVTALIDAVRQLLSQEKLRRIS
jgi:DNA-binding NtrC family response regulator